MRFRFGRQLSESEEYMEQIKRDGTYHFPVQSYHFENYYGPNYSPPENSADTIEKIIK